MELRRFRVTDFRSVRDSGWIDVGDVTALIGTNESGKTNLLMPLWKLNPAMDGEIDLISDIPRKRYSEIKQMKQKPIFIRAQFELSSYLAQRVASKCGCDPSEVSVAEVSKDFGGQLYVTFPGEITPSILTCEILCALATAEEEIGQQQPATQTEAPLKERILDAIRAARERLASSDERVCDLSAVLDACEVDLSSGAKRSSLVPRYERLVDEIKAKAKVTERPTPSSVEACRQLVADSLLKFVYYSNYGNLDSEIYLPYVIENMKRTDLGTKEQAKARTLRVLFDFVRLGAKEILELGKDFDLTKREPTAEELESIAIKKKERSILLTSAASRLTSEFKDWWQQGDYVFDFQADGDHFRVWVSDDRRPEKIELENRSTGLQWFLSFFLVFLVESNEAHHGTMLLLDEPGLSLHPLAQKDLSLFFESLAQKNQICYTTHSPFLVDSDHLDRVKAVYVDESGATAVSANLRAVEDKSQSRSVYPVHAALGLSVSTMLLEGCQPVIVEGASDQISLSAIKTVLVGSGVIAPKRELLFMPCGGAKGATTLAALMAGRDGALPVVIFDSDTIGKSEARKLRDGLYKGSEASVLLLGELISIDGAEIEDLFPPLLVAREVSRRLFPPGDVEFEDLVKVGEPIVPQIEQFAQSNGIDLAKGWKVELATFVKSRVLRDPSTAATVRQTWETVFNAILR